MRRAVVGSLVAALVAATPATRPARAEPAWTVTAEAGAEADSNVQRVETGPGLDTDAVGAAVLRAGGHLDGKSRALGGAYAVALGALGRVVDRSSVSSENVALLTGDLRWLHPIGARPVSAGIGLTAADAVALTDETGARTFRNLGADGVLALRDADDHRLTLAAGWRDFAYKPDHAFDWSGPAANARLDLSLWQSASKTRSLELAATVAFEARAYESTALANNCAPGAPPNPACSAGTSLRRRDRYERAGLELVYAGGVVATLGYAITVIDSNSYSYTLARHRVLGSITAALPWRLYGTALVELQIDQYADGYLLSTDLTHLEFQSLDDENRSSVQVRVARALTSTWSLEARAALWRDLGTTMATTFHRELGYLGLVYSH